MRFTTDTRVAHPISHLLIKLVIQNRRYIVLFVNRKQTVL